MRGKVTLFIFILIYILVDIYVFQALKSAIGVTSSWKYLIWGGYWSVALASWVGLYFLPRMYEYGQHQNIILVYFIFGLCFGHHLVLDVLRWYCRHVGY